MYIEDTLRLFSSYLKIAPHLVQLTKKMLSVCFGAKVCEENL